MGEHLHLVPTWRDTAQFLDSFWPQAIATLVGIALGIPAALFIDRVVRRSADEAVERENADRLRTACKILDEALAANVDALFGLDTALKGGQTNAGLVLSSASYNVIKDDLASYPTRRCGVSSRGSSSA